MPFRFVSDISVPESTVLVWGWCLPHRWRGRFGSDVLLGGLEVCFLAEVLLGGLWTWTIAVSLSLWGDGKLSKFVFSKRLLGFSGRIGDSEVLALVLAELNELFALSMKNLNEFSCDLTTDWNNSFWAWSKYLKKNFGWILKLELFIHSKQLRCEMNLRCRVTLNHDTSNSSHILIAYYE
jgi:hypothetical protein